MQEEAAVRRLYEDVWTHGNLAIVDEIIDRDIVDHTPLPMQAPGVEGFVQLVTMVRIAFPDLHVTIDDLFGDGDRVACRWTASGTNSGPMMGFAATDQVMTVEGIDIFRLAGGKIVEHWGKIDAVGLMQQLGIVPPRFGPE